MGTAESSLELCPGRRNLGCLVVYECLHYCNKKCIKKCSRQRSAADKDKEVQQVTVCEAVVSISALYLKTPGLLY